MLGHPGSSPDYRRFVTDRTKLAATIRDDASYGIETAGHQISRTGRDAQASAVHAVCANPLAAVVVVTRSRILEFQVTALLVAALFAVLAHLCDQVLRVAGRNGSLPPDPARGQRLS